MKKEQERDKKFEFMWNELQVIIKGLNTIENRYIIYLFLLIVIIILILIFHRSTTLNETNSTIPSKTIPIHKLLLSTR